MQQQGGKDFVKIVDFGIAKDTGLGMNLDAAQSSTILQAEATRTASGESSSAHDQLTRAGLGTPLYMAPEQVKGATVDPRADQYALGGILFRMLTGEVPFRGTTALATMTMHLGEPVPQVRERCPDVVISDSLEALVTRAMAKEPEDRYVSMTELADALEIEIDLLLIQRGERVALPAGTAALLGGKLRGSHLMIAGRRLPLWAVAATALLLGLGGFLIYRQVAQRRLAASSRLRPGELAALQKSALGVIKDNLYAPSLDSRLRALVALGQMRDGTLGTLVKPLLADPAAPVQAQAAETLGQLGDRSMLPALQQQLEHSTVPAVRLAAAHALDQLGAPQGRQFLQQAMTEDAADTRLRAAFLLCGSGDAKAQTLLTATLAGGKLATPIALDILSCLASSGDEAARQKLLALLDGSGSRPSQLAVAAKLAQLGENKGRQFLRELTSKSGPEQVLAARLLVAPDEPEAVALLRGLAKNAQAALAARLMAVEGLGAGGQTVDARLLGGLLVGEHKGGLRLSAAGAIVQLASGDPALISNQSLVWARSALGDDNWAIRDSAVAVLGDSPDAAAVSLLTDVLKDNDARVRRSAARALGRQIDRGALAALRTGLTDSDADVRLESLRALGRVARLLQKQGAANLLRDAATWFQGVLSGGSAQEQTVARGVLLQLGDQSQRQPLSTLSKSTDHEVRRLLIEQSDGNPELVSPLLRDPVFAVRLAAAIKLAEAGDHSALPVLTEALLKGGPAGIVAYGLIARLGEKVTAPSDLKTALDGLSVPDRMAAVEAMGHMPADLALPLLTRAAHDQQPLVRRLVAEVAADLPAAADGPPGISVLRLLITDRDAAVRARAAVLLARVAMEKAAAAEPPAPSPNTGAKGAAGDKTTPKNAAPVVDAATAPADLGASPDASVPSTERPSGHGKLLIEAAGNLVQFQVEQSTGHNAWQSVSGQTITLPAGTYHVNFLTGSHDVTIEDKQTTKIKVPEAPVEKLARSGLESYQRKDYRSAQKLLEKANSMCARDHKHGQACANLSRELSFGLAQTYESQQRWAEAMSEYQKLATGKNKTDAAQRAAVQEAIIRLASRVGAVVSTRTVNKKCQEVQTWLPPGTHLLDVGGESQTVKVRAGQTVKIGSCE